MGIAGRDYVNQTPVVTSGTGSETFHVDLECHHVGEHPTVETLKAAVTSWMAPNEPCKTCSPPMEECLRIAIQEDGVHPALLKPKPEDRGLTRTGHPTHFGGVEA